MVSFRPHYGPGVDPASNRNEYQEYALWSKGVRCVGLTTIPPSCVECLEIWALQPPGILRACPGEIALPLQLCYSSCVPWKCTLLILTILCIFWVNPVFLWERDNCVDELGRMWVAEVSDVTEENDSNPEMPLHFPRFLKRVITGL
jgi:hypothetical protein